MMRKYHVRFLEEGAGVTQFPYSTLVSCQPIYSLASTKKCIPGPKWNRTQYNFIKTSKFRIRKHAKSKYQYPKKNNGLFTKDQVSKGQGPKTSARPQRPYRRSHSRSCGRRGGQTGRSPQHIFDSHQYFLDNAYKYTVYR